MTLAGAALYANRATTAREATSLSGRQLPRRGVGWDAVQQQILEVEAEIREGGNR